MKSAMRGENVISLGIDQGIANVGFGLTTLDEHGEEMILFSGVFKTTSKHREEKRIRMIYEFINELILSYNVKVIGLEKLFFNAVQKNTGRNKSASILRTQMVSGAIYLLAGIHEIPISDYTPGTVKKYVAGHGRASKEDVMKHINEIAQRSGIELTSDHQADAVGISLTALHKFIESQK